MKTFEQFLESEKAISTVDVKDALKATKNASSHTKKVNAANPTHKMPHDLSRFAAYSKTVAESHTSLSHRSSYSGPGQGEAMHKLSVDQHLACMNHHANEQKKVIDGTAKYSSTYSAEDVKKQLVQHKSMYQNHQEAIQKLGDVGNPHKD